MTTPAMLAPLRSAVGFAALRLEGIDLALALAINKMFGASMQGLQHLRHCLPFMNPNRISFRGSPALSRPIEKSYRHLSWLV
jgi:hypothetical protein